MIHTRFCRHYPSKGLYREIIIKYCIQKHNKVKQYQCMARIHFFNSLLKERAKKEAIFRVVLMGTKSCIKILIFSTRFSCENLAVEDFVTLYLGKNLVDGELFYLGMVSTNLYMLFYVGEIQMPKAGSSNIFCG